MSETRRMVWRVGTNYLGLFANLVIGVVLTRELIGTLGRDGFGLVALFGTTAGIGVMIQDIVKQTMIRELGFALHHEEGDFKATQADAFGVSAIVAMITAVIFGVLWALVPLLEVPEELIGAARLFILAKLIQSVAFVLAAPLYNLYIITERMAWANALLVIERIVMLASILAVPFMIESDTGARLIAYGWLSAASISLVTLASAVGLAVVDAKLRPSFGRMTRAGVKDLLKKSAVQGTAVTSVNLHPRIDSFIVNNFVGLAGNMAFGLGFQFASYIRRVAVGMTQGLDAVTARFTAKGGDKDVRWLLRRSTQLHAAVIFPIAAFAIYFTPSLIDLWVGDLISNEKDVKGLVEPTVIVLAVGMSARALSDAWLRILYGAGKVDTYLKPVVIAAVLNPILAIGLSLALPGKWNVIGPPLAMAGLFLVFHCGWIGVITMRELNSNARDVFIPLAGPAAATAVAGILTALVDIWVLPQSVWSIVIATTLFGLLYFAFCFYIVMNGPQRELFFKRLGRIKKRQASHGN